MVAPKARDKAEAQATPPVALSRTDAGTDRLPASFYQQAAVATIIRNYTEIAFDLIARRVGEEAEEVVRDVEHAFIDRSLGRLDKCVTLGQSLRAFVSELSQIDPLKLNLPRLRGVDPITEYNWDQAIRRLDDRAGYEESLARLQELLRRHTQRFTRAADFPRTLDELEGYLAQGAT